jgi:hypothetical protein
MPSSSTNLGLTLYDRTSDTGSLFIDFRDNIAGTGGTSNMNKIDTAVQDVRNNITSLEGVGYTNQTVKGNADNIQANKQLVMYTALASGTNTLTATISQLTSVQNNVPMILVPSAKNTSAVTLNINSYGALPVVKVRNVTGSTVYTSLEAGDLEANMPVLVVKDSTGVRYLMSNFGEEYARNVFYANADGTYSTVQSMIDSLNVPTRSADQTVQAPAVTYVSGTEDGTINYTIGGQSLNNSVTNGNFASGTTGWSVSGGTQSASSNTDVVTGDGSQSYARIITTTSIPCISGKKVYLRTSARVTNTSATSITFTIRGSSTPGTSQSITQSPPVQYQWYSKGTLSGVLTVPGDATGNIRVDVIQNYADAATANGKVMEVCDVICIDLDAHGLSSYTAAQLDGMTDIYFDSLTNVVNPVLTSEGKNLFNASSTNYTTAGALPIFDGKTWTFATAGNSTRNMWIRIYERNPESGSSGGYIGGFQSSSTGALYGNLTTDTLSMYNLIVGLSGDVQDSKRVYPIKLKPNTAYTVSCTVVSSAANLIVANSIQLEEGSSATTYEPYQSNTLSIAGTLRSLPNGVRDTVIQTGAGAVTLTQNVSTDYTLVSGDMTAYTTSDTNNDYVEMSYTNLTGISAGLDIVGTKMLTTVTIPRNSATFDSTANVWTHSFDTSKWYIFVPKGTYANLAAAQTALAGRKLLYQMATPTTSTLFADDWVSYKSGRYTTNTAVVPQVVYNTPIDLAEKLDDTFGIASRTEAKLDVLAMPITMIGASTTITSIPAALTEISTAYRTKYDLSKCGQIRLTLAVKTIGSTNSEVRIQYSTDDTNWNYLDGSTGPAVNIFTTGTKASSWATLVSGAKADVYLRAVTINGDATASPVIGNVTLQAR